MKLNGMDAITTRTQKVVLDFVMLAVGLMVTVSAVVLAGAIDEIEPRTVAGRPSASQPQIAHDPPGSRVRTTPEDKATYLAVSSQHAAQAMTLLVSQDAAVAAMLGESHIVVVSTSEQYEDLFAFVALINMELMESEYFVDLLDLRGHGH
jgi:hypothetical protein